MTHIQIIGPEGPDSITGDYIRETEHRSLIIVALQKSERRVEQIYSLLNEAGELIETLMQENTNLRRQLVDMIGEKQ